MRTPNLAKNLIESKKVAVEFWASEDWRFKFLAFYVLQFYLKPIEIAKFLRVRPHVILTYMKALVKIRKEPKLIRAESLADVFKVKETRNVEEQKQTLEQILGLEDAIY